MEINKDKLISFFMKETSEEDNKEILAWINESNENFCVFRNLKAKWELFENKFIPIDTEKAFKTIKNKSTRKPLFTKLLKFSKMAAVFLLGIGVSALLTTIINTSNTKLATAKSIEYNQVTSPKGQKTKLILADGTEVWLASESKLTFPTNFDEDVRQVSLEGQGYFEVIKNPKKTFVVNTKNYKIQVYGTKFNIKNYDNDNISEISLYSGSISLTLSGDIKECLIRPTQKIILNKTSLLSNIEKTDEDDLLWKYGFMSFNNEKMELIAKKLEKFYNVKINFSNKNIKQLRFTGRFDEETVVEALDAIRLISPFNYTKNKNKITIKPNKKQSI